MCRYNVPFLAEEAVARLLRDIAQALADGAHIEMEQIRIGAVDFGQPPHEPVVSP